MSSWIWWMALAFGLLILELVTGTFYLLVIAVVLAAAGLADLAGASLTPPQVILHAMQEQITAEREKRALISSSEGRKQEQINIATGEREGAIARSEGEKQAQINIVQGKAGAVLAIAEATAEAIRKVAQAIQSPGGMDAVNLKVAEKYVEAFAGLAKTSKSLILPANLADVGGLIAAAMTVVKQQQAGKA